MDLEEKSFSNQKLPISILQASTMTTLGLKKDNSKGISFIIHLAEKYTWMGQNKLDTSRMDYMDSE